VGNIGRKLSVFSRQFSVKAVNLSGVQQNGLFVPPDVKTFGSKKPNLLKQVDRQAERF
jgi:hypothetical protein